MYKQQICLEFNVHKNTETALRESFDPFIVFVFIESGFISLLFASFVPYEAI